VRITFLCPHVRIAGGVRAILAYADRLAARGHDTTLVVPARNRVDATWRNLRGAGPDWVPGFRGRIRWVATWTPETLPEGDAVVATAWQSAGAAATAPSACGAKFYLVQHYESLYHGAPDAVDATYWLPLRKIVISTWLRELMRERFGSPAEVLVTPVDLELFHPTPAEVSTSRPRVLMLHHEYAWKGVADGLEAVVQAERSGFARFAGSEVHQPTLIENVSVFLRVIRGNRVGAAAANRIDDEGLRELALRAGEAADASPEDPDLPALAGASQLPDVGGNDEETAALGPADQARLDSRPGDDQSAQFLGDEVAQDPPAGPAPAGWLEGDAPVLTRASMADPRWRFGTSGHSRSYRRRNWRSEFP